ncbi:hypothetical protein [Sphaerisporangium aureirubrum]|uniref:Mce-associated membrane protein n=1 Tax=Sphaerisporangium aureirubrum TaxID=1544736 RepID=A0ABW1NVV1_9ACTN
MVQLRDRRGLAFAGVVVALAAVGVYLTLRPASSGPDVPDPAGRPAAVVSPGPVEPVTGTPAPRVSPGTFDIYRYLPLTRQQIAEAADAAQRFAVSYATYRHDEDPASYAERLKAFTTVEFGTVLSRDVTTPSTVEQNRAGQIISSGTASLKNIRDISDGSVVFVVTVVQHITGKDGPQERSADYAVTLTQVGDGWRVFDMQQADVGQEGDTGEGTIQ